MILHVDSFEATTIAMCVFFLGYAIVMRCGPLRRYGIPESVVGGLVIAVAAAAAHAIADAQVEFDLSRRDILLVYFFAALGLRSSLRDMAANGRPLLLFVALAAAFIVLQNAVGAAVATAMGFDPQVGVIGGSIALVGRSGTTVAWAPIFEEALGLQHLSRLGLGVNMAGMIAACAIGGPIASWLIARRRIATPGPSADLDVGVSRDADAPKLDYHAFLLALLRVHVAILLGQALAIGLEALGVRLPLYVLCLIGGILLGPVRPRIGPELDWSASDQCLTLIAYVSLGLFYTMTVMSQQLWTAGTFVWFLVVVILAQVALTVVFSVFVVFRAMGRDYDAAVLSAGFAGIALGSTATTMAIMTAVAKQHGRAHRAFVIAPLACGIFIDIVNSLAIAAFAAL